MSLRLTPPLGIVLVLTVLVPLRASSHPWPRVEWAPPGAAPASEPAAPASEPAAPASEPAAPASEPAAPASEPAALTEAAPAPTVASEPPLEGGSSPPAGNDCDAYCAAMETTCPDVFLGNVDTCLATCALYPPGALAAAPLRCNVYGQTAAPHPVAPPSTPPEATHRGMTLVMPDLTRAADSDPILQADRSLIPPGFGAVFLPTAGLALLKDRAPLVGLYQGRALVAEGPIGRRLVVQPGNYQVRLGSGAYEQQMSIAAQVVSGRTTIIPPTWSALEVNVVDPQFVPFRGTYELLRSDTREVMGLGFGADELLGERLKIWVLPPGLYKLIESGGTYRDRTNFATVRLLPGAFTRFVLVQDPDTSQLLGAGEVELDPEEADRTWTLRGVTGGALSFHNSTVTGAQAGWFLGGELFLDVTGAFDRDPHLWLTRLEVEERQSRSPISKRFQNQGDRLFFHTIYTYRLLPWFGPYGRVGLLTQMFPREQEFPQPRTVDLQDEDEQTVETLVNVDRVAIADYFSPIELKEGLGGNFQVLRSRDAELDLRVGLGSRQFVSRGFRVYQRSESGNDRVVRLPSSHSEGVEGTAVALVRITRWVTVSSEFDGLEPFNEGQALILTWRNQASLRLASFASLNYRFNLVRDEARTVDDRLQTEQDLQLRFSYTLF